MEQLDESQKRATVLARANAAMAKTISRLADQPDVRHFVGQALEVFAQEFNAVGAEFWRYDPATDLFGPILSYERSTGVVLGAEKDWSEMNALRPTSLPQDSHQRDQARRAAAKNERIYYMHHREIESDPILEPFRERLRAQSIRTILSVPIFLKDEHLGVVCLRLDHDRTLNLVEEEFAFALAQQMALALQMSRLAEEAKQVAIAREKEQAAKERAARLAQANQALKASLANLARDQDIDSYLGHALRAITDQLGSPSSTLWKFDRDNPNIASLDLVYEAGKVVPGGRHPLRIEKNVSDNTQHAGHQRILRGEQLVKDVATYEGFLPGQREYLQQQNIATLLSTPIMVGERALGTYVAHFTEKRIFQPEELEFVHTLAQQTALALEFTRLAEEAKQAAIAREKEQAATEKVEELVKANDALRRSVDSLMDLESINDFLSISLRTIADVLGVPSACFWKNQDGFSHLELVYENGHVIAGKESDHPNARSPNPLDVRMEYLGGKLKTEPFTVRTDDPDVPFTPDQRKMLEKLGVRALISIPIILEGVAMARINARLTHEMPDPTQSRIELIRALANQAALALQVSRLAEEAKQTAVLGERARIAGEIHDSLAQAFAGISLHLEASFAAKRKGKKESSDFLENARQMAAFGLAEARSSVLTLKPNVLDQGDLSGMLRQLAERSSVKGHLECEFVETGVPVVLCKELKHATFRVVQEALGNALKHAQPKNIRFTLQYNADRFSVSVQDDGTGFTATEIKQGFGLRGMQERCEERGGQFQIKSKSGQGTTLTVTFPITAK